MYVYMFMQISVDLCTGTTHPHLKKWIHQLPLTAQGSKSRYTLTAGIMQDSNSTAHVKKKKATLNMI